MLYRLSAGFCGNHPTSIKTATRGGPGDLVSVELWQQCIDFLRDELPSQQFNTWIRPLQADGDQSEIRLYAPNRFVLDWVNDKYLNRIQELLDDLSHGQAPLVSLLIGSRRTTSAGAVAPRPSGNATSAPSAPASQPPPPAPRQTAPAAAPRSLNPMKRIAQRLIVTSKPVIIWSSTPVT